MRKEAKRVEAGTFLKGSDSAGGKGYCDPGSSLATAKLPLYSG